jgi:hypothetical protein
MRNANARSAVGYGGTREATHEHSTAMDGVRFFNFADYIRHSCWLLVEVGPVLLLHPRYGSTLV